MTTAQVKKHNIAGVEARNGLTVYCDQKILCLNTAIMRIIELLQCYMKCWLLSCTSKQLLNLWNISAIWLNYLHVLSKLKWLGSWYRPYQKSSTRYTWRLLAPQLQDRAVEAFSYNLVFCVNPGDLVFSLRINRLYIRTNCVFPNECIQILLEVSAQQTANNAWLEKLSRSRSFFPEFSWRARQELTRFVLLIRKWGVTVKTYSTFSCRFLFILVVQWVYFQPH